MKPFVRDAKLRVSYGVTGNEEIGDYVSLLLYGPDYIYAGIAGIAPVNLAYGDLGWERTTQFNVGLDLSLYRNRIRIVADYYKKNTDRLLNRVEIPKETGFKTSFKNVGAMSNEGVEFSFGYDIIQKRNFKWNVDLNWSTNDSRITKIADGVPFYKGLDQAIFVRENSRLGEFYGYKYLGIFSYDESNAFSEDWKQLTPVFGDNGTFSHYTLEGGTYSGVVKKQKTSTGETLLGGDVNYVDKNQDGIIDVRDKDIIGCAQPDFFGGVNTTFSYRNFSLFLSFYYSIGGEIYNYAESKRNRFSLDGATPSPNAIHNMWTKQGDQAIFPLPAVIEHNRLAPSNFYLEDASYIKLKNIRLTYNIPASVTKKLGLRIASVQVYGKNILTLTDYTGYDPEFTYSTDPLTMGIDTNRYPRKREFGFGLTAGF
jgi:hypothetical protein